MSTQLPFSNGTEEDAWMSKWCAYCTHDHGIDEHDGCGDGCDVLLFTMLPDELPWPECWAAAPDFWKHVPARIACLKFEPCTKDGCDGDPGAGERPAYVASIFDDMRSQS